MEVSVSPGRDTLCTEVALRMSSEQAHGTGTRSGSPAGRMRLAGSDTPKSMAFAARVASGSAEKSAVSSASFRSGEERVRE
jgi:hypothetical protein